MPQRGPLARKRMSLAIFIRSAARALRAPWVKTYASLEVRAWNLLGEGRKDSFVMAEICLQQISSKPGGQLSPVPTAVPPMARSRR